MTIQNEKKGRRAQICFVNVFTLFTAERFSSTFLLSVRRKNLISIYHEQTDGNVKHSVADTGCSQSNLVALRQMHDLKNTLSVNQGLLCLSLKPLDLTLIEMTVQIK